MHMPVRPRVHRPVVCCWECTNIHSVVCPRRRRPRRRRPHRRRRPLPPPRRRRTHRRKPHRGGTPANNSKTRVHPVAYVPIRSLI